MLLLLLKLLVRLLSAAVLLLPQLLLQYSMQHEWQPVMHQCQESLVLFCASCCWMARLHANPGACSSSCVSLMRLAAAFCASDAINEVLIAARTRRLRHGWALRRAGYLPGSSAQDNPRMRWSVHYDMLPLITHKHHLHVWPLLLPLPVLEKWSATFQERFQAAGSSICPHH